MQAHDFRNLDQTELDAKVQQLQAEYFSAQEAVRLGKNKNYANLKELKRDIARAKTVLQEIK